MENKQKVIDSIIKLYEFGRNLPFFNTEFSIIAENKDIEEYILSIVQVTDLYGKPLSEKQIRFNKRKAISDFRKSEGYNPNGKSTLKMTKVFTLSSINFHDVRKIVNGEADRMPKGYQFVGDFSLFKNENI